MNKEFAENLEFTNFIYNNYIILYNYIYYLMLVYRSSSKLPFWSAFSDNKLYIRTCT